MVCFFVVMQITYFFVLQTYQILCFTLLLLLEEKKTAASCRLLCEVCGEYFPMQRTYEYRLRCLTDGDFDPESKKCPGQSKKLDDIELEGLLDEDSCEMPNELAEPFQVTQVAISLLCVGNDPKGRKLGTI